ncbi:MAG TPA: hypothetical protein VFK40_02595 [Nitrososphaeraceae archaeon]|nr:hypothetical protein [Nitrososphaeraceae archaeon]
MYDDGTDDDWKSEYDGCHALYDDDGPNPDAENDDGTHEGPKTFADDDGTHEY